MAEIVDVHAREILDSRGNPTLEVEVHLDSSFNVASGHGGRHGGNDGDADDQPATTTQG